MAWGRDDKVGGLKDRAGLILEAEAGVVSWAVVLSIDARCCR